MTPFSSSKSIADQRLAPTTVISSAGAVNNGGTNFINSISLSGFLATPAGNLRIDCKDITATTGVIIFNGSGNSKDSTISAYRIQ